MSAIRDIPLNALGPGALMRISGEPSAGRVLCLHALGLNRLAFDGMRNHVDPAWQLHSYDFRGHGALQDRSGFTLDDLVDDACRVIDQLDGPVHLVGHALGSVVAALTCVRRPAIRSLTLLTPATQGWPIFRARAEEAEREGVEGMIEPTLQRWFGTNELADRPEIVYARSALRSMGANAYSSGWRALAAFPGYSDLVRHLPPTLCLAAEEDLSTPPSSMQGMIKVFAEVGRGAPLDFKAHARGGHMLPLSEPAWVAGQAARHWARWDAGVPK